MLNLSSQRVNEKVQHDKLYSLRSLQGPDPGRTFAKFLASLCVVLVILLFLPWQQNIRGKGAVTAFNPSNRPQTIESVIAGRIKKWYVREGQLVNQGDTIITITEIKEKYFDPNLLIRLSEQIKAKENSLVAKGDKANSLKNQIIALKESRKNKLAQTQAKVEAEQVRYQNAENQFQRNKKLYEAGNIPLTKYQEFEYKYQGAMAEYQNMQTELTRLEAEYAEKISKATSDLNSTRAEIFETEAELAKLRNEFANMRIRNQQYQVLAPQTGYIVKAMKQGIGETIKEGDAVCTVLPQANGDMAVEMYVKAMDVPLISKERRVRIVFDGWPALQFSGWPSVSVGTFGGVVKVIDYVNSKPGQFRILVTPDPNDEPWPKQLRMGSGIKGWVMLNDVPVWYEIWRQLNGFPPSLYHEPLDEVIEAKPENKEDPQYE
ncbi:MAG: HlyD family secretion protein [Cyclobacteriaceae bacterium]